MNDSQLIDLPQLQERLKREGVKTHKERVEELNKYLSRLSEHHDMYVIRALFLLCPSRLSVFACPRCLDFLATNQHIPNFCTLQAQDWTRLNRYSTSRMGLGCVMYFVVDVFVRV